MPTTGSRSTPPSPAGWSPRSSRSGRRSPIAPVEPGGWDNRSFRLGAGDEAPLPERRPLRRAGGQGAPLAAPSSRRACRCRSPRRWRGRARRRAIPGPGRCSAGWPASPPRPRRSPTAPASPADLARFLRALQAIPAAGGPAAGAAQLLPRRPARHLRRRDPPLPRGARRHGRCATARPRSGTPRSRRAGAAAGLGARRHRRRQPPRRGRPARRGDRLRQLGHRRPGLRPRPRLDLPRRRRPRRLPRRHAPPTPPTWARARGWALWKALLTLAGGAEVDRAGTDQRRVIADVIAEHRSARPGLRPGSGGAEDGEEGGAEALDLERAHALDALELGEAGGALLGDAGEGACGCSSGACRGRRRRGRGRAGRRGAGRRASPAGLAGEAAAGGVDRRRARSPVRTSRKAAPKRSSLTAPTPVMPAQRVEGLRAAGRHLDQGAVGEDDVGGHAGGVGERAAVGLQRGEQALVLLGHLGAAAARSGRRGGAADGVGAERQASPRRAGSGGRPR